MNSDSSMNCVIKMMCQHFSGHKVTQFFAAIHNLRVTNNHLQNEFSLGYKTPQYIQILRV